MLQRRLCEYLDLKCSHRLSIDSTHRLSILSLPSDIRRQIYNEANLITDNNVDLGRLPATESEGFTTSFGTIQALLRSNRIIYNELSSYVYSSNRFFIHYRTQRSLQPLRNLSPTALSSLRHLTVHLAVTSCEAGYPCCNAYPSRTKSCDEHDHALSISTNPEHVLFEWAHTATYIFTHIQPSTLHFYLVCDVTSLAAAQRVLAPLSTAPVLAACAIRLSRKFKPALQKLARETALRAMGCSPSSNPTFRFLDLPLELRIHILRFTDLVAPLAEIQFSPTRGYHLYYGSWCCGGTDCPAYIHRACAFRNCWDQQRNTEGYVGCFCAAEHTAYWTGCGCWRPPTPLFFVSKMMLEDVRSVFFGANRFITLPSSGARRIVSQSPSRLPAAVFLTQTIPRHALRHLRFLELVFPPFRTPWLLPHEPALRDWQEAIESVSDALSLPALTIRVSFADRRPYDERPDPPFRETVTKEEAMEIYTTYMRVVTPLRELKGLGRLCVSIAWPWEWTERGQLRRSRERELVQREIRDVEVKLEKIVMGATYQGGRLGEDELGRSQWQLVGLP